MSERVYLDYNATAPMKPAAADAMRELLGRPLNPSSVHGEGRMARQIVEKARATIADHLSAFPGEVIFTASATEANNTVLRGSTQRILVAADGHSSLLAAREDHEELPLLSDGTIDLAALERMLKDQPAAQVAVMLANNETGVIQPVADIAALVHAHDGLLHVDAVQGLGKVPVDMGLLDADSLCVSAHKMGGPVGVAALVVRQELAYPALLRGGGQESRRRAGTENVAAIAGFAAAAAAMEDLSRLRGWLDALEAEVMSEGGSVVGRDSRRVPNTSCVVMPGAGQEVQLMHFDLKGFAVSAGSACSSGRIEPSHVLHAMGMGDEAAKCAIRVSAGWATTEQEILAFGREWRQFSRGRSVRAA